MKKKRRSGSKEQSRRMKGRGENSGWEDKVMEEKRGSSIHRRRLNYLPPLAGWPRLHRQQSGRLLGIVRKHRPRLSTAQVFALSHLRGTSPAESPKTGTGTQSAVSAGSPWIPAGGKQAVLLLCSESERPEDGGGGGGSSSTKGGRRRRLSLLSCVY